MAADFNAGSIEGTLDLNATPFKQGLDKARMDAKDFEKGTYSPKADLDKTKFDVKKDEVTVEADKLDKKKIDPKADMDITAFMAKYAIMQKVLDAGGSGRGLTGVAMSGARIGMLVTGLLSVVAAAGPAGAAMAAFGAASVVALGGVYMSLGLFAAAAKSAFGEIEKANKAGVTLTGWAGKAQSALKGVTTEWHRLISGTQTPVFKVLTDAFHTAAGILPKLAPLLRVTALGVDGIVKSIGRLTSSPLFDHFLASLESFMHGFLAGAGPVLRDLLASFMHAFMVLTPLTSQLGHGIELAAAALRHFTAGGGLQTFVGYAEKSLPMVVGLLHNVVTGVFNLVKGLAPLAGPALAFIGALVSAIGHLHISPLAQGLGDVLDALRPLLPVAAELINIVLKPLGQLLSQIAAGPLHQITNGIQHELRPAFGALRGILHDLVHPLAEFAGSIANLANPTGIRLLAVALKSLQGVVHTAAPAFGKLAVAVENVIDNGINTLIPLLPLLGRALKAVATAAVPVVNVLAAILAHRAVADVILGIVAAVWLGQKAFLAYKIAAEGLAVVQGIIEAIQFGWAGLTVAEDANTSATVANKAAMVAYWAYQQATAVGTMIKLAALWTIQEAKMIATKVALIATTVATKAYAVAQWLLNAAMDANPIGLVVIAIAALAAGLIYAYKHSEVFRTVVNAAFSAVKNIAKGVFDWLKTAVVDVIDFVRQHWLLILAIVTGPVGALAIFVITHFSQIRDFIASAMSAIGNFVSTLIHNVVGWFMGLPGQIMGAAGALLHAGQSLMNNVWQGLKSTWQSIWSWATGLPGKIVGLFTGLAGSIGSAIRSDIAGAVNHLPGPLKSLAHKIGLASGGITSGITQAVVGDNPGGREAVIPLDKYDLPRKGASDRTAAIQHADNTQIIGLLTAMVGHLAGKDSGLADAIGNVINSNNDSLARKMLQAGRAA